MRKGGHDVRGCRACRECAWAGRMRRGGQDVQEWGELSGMGRMCRVHFAHLCTIQPNPRVSEGAETSPSCTGGEVSNTAGFAMVFAYAPRTSYPRWGPRKKTTSQGGSRIGSQKLRFPWGFRGVSDCDPKWISRKL